MLFTFRPYFEFLCIVYEGNIQDLTSIFTFYGYFTHHFGTPQLEKYRYMIYDIAWIFVMDLISGTEQEQTIHGARKVQIKVYCLRTHTKPCVAFGANFIAHTQQKPKRRVSHSCGRPAVIDRVKDTIRVG